MKKILLVISLLSLSLFAGLKEDISKVDFVAQNSIKVLQAVDGGSVYIVKGEVTRGEQKQIVNFFVSKDKKAVIFGKGFSANGEELVIPVNIKQYEGKEALKIGNGKNKYFVFTDPECPYCKKFEEMIREKNLTKNNTFYFYLYPLSFHKNAIPMSKFVLSHKTDMERWEALEDVEKKYKKKTLSKDVDTKTQKELDVQMKIAEELGIRGTPTVFDINGKQIDWTKLQ